MKKTIALLLVFIMVFALAACTSSNHEGEAKAPSGSSAQQGRDYHDVINDFKKQGFTNIKTEVLDDLITGWLHKDGEVKSVSIDGKQDYSPDVWYPKNVAVIITYHTFPKQVSSEEQSTQSSIVTDDGSKKIYDNAVGKPAIDILNELKKLGYTVSFKHAISKMDFTDEVLPVGDDFYIPWIITDVDSYSASSKTASFFINTKEMIDEAQSKSKVADALQAKLDVMDAWQAVESYGTGEFPNGFRVKLGDRFPPTAEDENTWFLKANYEVKNANNKWVKGGVVEAHVSGTTASPQIVDFKVY